MQDPTLISWIRGKLSKGRVARHRNLGYRDRIRNEEHPFPFAWYLPDMLYTLIVL